MASRGSVIPLFVNQIQDKKPITITDPNMTRFMMTLDEEVELVLYAFEKVLHVIFKLVSHLPAITPASFVSVVITNLFLGIFCYLFYLINFQKYTGKVKPDKIDHFRELNSQQI